MSDARRFEVNQNEVAAKVMDGEAIIMNIANGAYYSMAGVGARVWEHLERGCSVAETVATIAGEYDVAMDLADRDIGALVATLLEERLLVESVALTEAATPPVPSAGARLPYETPVLQKYTDMADMLALDPPMPGFDETPWAKV